MYIIDSSFLELKRVLLDETFNDGNPKRERENKNGVDIEMLNKRWNSEGESKK